MARAMSKANGSPSERVMHYFIAAFERRLNGTAYMHLTAPVRKARRSGDWGRCAVTFCG